MLVTSRATAAFSASPRGLQIYKKKKKNMEKSGKMFLTIHDHVLRPSLLVSTLQ